MSGVIPGAGTLADVAATGAMALEGRDNLRYLTASADAFARAALRNAKKPRGGVAFDRTAGTRVATVASAVLAINTDPRSIVWVKRIPTVAPGSDSVIWQLANSTSPTANCLRCVHRTNGTLQFRIFGATASDYRETTTNDNVVTTLGGKEVVFAFVADAAGRTLYANGVAITLGADATAGTAPTNWQAAVCVASGLIDFQQANGYTLRSATIYNLALSAADVQEIYELGGAVPERFKFGSQADRITGDDQTFTGGVGNWSSAGIGGPAVAVSASGGKLILTATNLASQNIARTTVAGATVTAGRVYRHSFKHRLASGSTASTFRVGGRLVHYSPLINLRNGALTFTATATEAQHVVEGTAAHPTDDLIIGKTSVASETFVLELDDYRVVQLGAVVHLDSESGGAGFQWHDSSSNKLDATLTATGVTWLQPRRRGFTRARLTWAGTHEAKSLNGGIAAIPANAVVDRITTKATAASTGVGLILSSVNTAGRFVAANAYTTAKKVHAIANQLPLAAANGDLDMILDPDSANYTGTIDIEVHYTVTKGNPT